MEKETQAGAWPGTGIGWCLENNEEQMITNDNVETIDEQTSQKQRSKKQRKTKQPNTGVLLKTIHPKTENQRLVMDIFDHFEHMVIDGCAGTGKTLLALYLSLNAVMCERSGQSKVVIIKSAVPTRDIGFLPGNPKEKQKAYEQPYSQLFSTLFERDDAYEVLKNRGVVDFMTTSFVRGITIDNTMIVVDEYQNMTFHELDSLITRVGQDSRIIFCGDTEQSDLQQKPNRMTAQDFIAIIRTIDGFCTITMDENDIVRSGLVKQYIMAKHKFCAKE